MVGKKGCLTGGALRLCPSVFGVLAQLVERLNGIEEVRGSNPLGSISHVTPNPLRRAGNQAGDVFFGMPSNQFIWGAPPP